MAVWKRNLYILWLGSFLSSIGMSMIIPFLPLYVQELGIHDMKEAAMWAAIIFAANHVMIALVSPFWGRLSDSLGQKTMMVRSGIGMAVVIAAMGFAQTPLQLILLRMAFGCVAGFSASASALLATEAPKEHAGRALGTLQTGNMCGQLFGPICGGIMAETYGMRNSFYLTGILIMLSTVLVIFGVKETSRYTGTIWGLLKQFGKNVRNRGAHILPAPDQAQAQAPTPKTLPAVIKQYPVILLLFFSSFLICVSLLSIEPVITLYVKSMNVKEHVEIMAGLVFASSALGAILAAPFLGRLGDRYGHIFILLISLFVMSLLYIPQAWITNAWLLLSVRFLTGLCIGGMLPAIAALLRRLTPIHIQGSVFGYLSSANSLGNVSGALFGGVVANVFGITHIFYIISCLIFIHFVMLLFSLQKLSPAAIRRHEAENSVDG
jgi:DHA1 family multidrug resistance protein-like MFS transporter